MNQNAIKNYEYLQMSICTGVPLKVIMLPNQIQMEITFKVGKGNLELDLSLCDSNLSLTVELLRYNHFLLN